MLPAVVGVCMSTWVVGVDPFSVQVYMQSVSICTFTFHCMPLLFEC